MEGSGKNKPVDQADPKVIFGNAGLPAKSGAAWMKTPLHFGRNFKRDAAAADKILARGRRFFVEAAEKAEAHARAAIGSRHNSEPIAAARANDFSKTTPTRSTAS